jgi:hypothetical protein
LRARAVAHIAVDSGRSDWGRLTNCAPGAGLSECEFGQKESFPLRPYATAPEPACHWSLSNRTRGCSREQVSRLSNMPASGWARPFSGPFMGSHGHSYSTKYYHILSECQGENGFWGKITLKRHLGNLCPSGCSAAGCEAIGALAGVFGLMDSLAGV